jgi:hypothetical protein
MLDLTPFQFTQLDDGRVKAAPFETKLQEEAMAERFQLTHRDGWHVIIAVPKLSNGERQVWQLECSASAPQVLNGLNGRQRIGIELLPSGELVMELMQSHMDSWQPPLRPTRRKVSEDELDAGAQRSVEGCLVALGARFGTKEHLVGDAGKHRGYPCAVFPRKEPQIAAVAFALVRVLPLHYENERRIAAGA